VICGIIATHGRLGEELIRTAERIAGPQTGLDFVSNEGLSADSLASVIRRRMAECEGAAGIVVMTDVPGGSTTLACRSLRLEGRRAWVVSGVNLPMVLAFIQCRRSLDPEEAARAVADRGAKAIEVVC